MSGHIIDVDCPSCKAPAGASCRTASGARLGSSHAARAQRFHRGQHEALPDEIVVRSQRYRLRRYTGRHGGHGWIRENPNGHSSEVGQEVKLLLDEIARLREG